MVSKARLLLPEPERPVITTSLSRGMVTSIFLRLCSQAPCITILSGDIELNHPPKHIETNVRYDTTIQSLSSAVMTPEGGKAGRCLYLHRIKHRFGSLYFLCKRTLAYDSIRMNDIAQS